MYERQLEQICVTGVQIIYEISIKKYVYRNLNQKNVRLTVMWWCSVGLVFHYPTKRHCEHECL